MATHLTATVAFVVISFWSMVSVVRTRPKKMLSCVRQCRVGCARTRARVGAPEQGRGAVQGRVRQDKS